MNVYSVRKRVFVALNHVIRDRVKREIYCAKNVWKLERTQRKIGTRALTLSCAVQSSKERQEIGADGDEDARRGSSMLAVAHPCIRVPPGR